MDDKGKESTTLEEEDYEKQYDNEAPPDVGNKISSIIHRTCHIPHNEVESQTGNLFRTSLGTIKLRKVHDIIIDNENTDNLNFWKITNKLTLTIENHSRP